MRNISIILFIFIIGILGVFIVWLNNFIYIKSKEISDLKDERDIWFSKYVQEIDYYYKRRWFYEDKKFDTADSSFYLVPRSDIHASEDTIAK
jgi:hypothetical protein